MCVSSSRPASNPASRHPKNLTQPAFSPVDTDLASSLISFSANPKSRKTIKRGRTYNKPLLAKRRFPSTELPPSQASQPCAKTQPAPHSISESLAFDFRKRQNTHINPADRKLDIHIQTKEQSIILCACLCLSLEFFGRGFRFPGLRTNNRFFDHSSISTSRGEPVKLLSLYPG